LTKTSPVDHRPAPTSWSTPTSCPSALTSWREQDLLVTGYLSAVARELGHYGLAESGLRLGPPEDDLLAGSLELEPIPGAGRGLVSLSWAENTGWFARETGSRSDHHEQQEAHRCRRAEDLRARRYLHPMAVPDPRAVARFAADVVAGRDVGMVFPTSCPCHEHGLVRGRAKVLADLAHFALPEVRSWLQSGAPE
jgi:hypothetical protein